MGGQANPCFVVAKSIPLIFPYQPTAGEISLHAGNHLLCTRSYICCVVDAAKLVSFLFMTLLCIKKWKICKLFLFESQIWAWNILCLLCKSLEVSRAQTPMKYITVQTCQNKCLQIFIYLSEFLQHLIFYWNPLSGWADIVCSDHVCISMNLAQIDRTGCHLIICI